MCASPASTVAGAALLLAIFGMASRVLGLIRDRILASNFGAGDVLDAYYAAFRLPDFLYAMLVLGALSAAFIPVFTRVYETVSVKQAWRLLSDFLITLAGLMAVLAAIAALCMPHLLFLIAPGFEGEKREMTILLSRIMLLSPVLLGVSAVFGGTLVARGSFLAYAIAPILYNLGIIFGAVVLVPEMGPSGLAWGVILGAVLHCGIQVFATVRSGYQFSFPSGFPWKNSEVIRIMRLMGPQVFSAASNQIHFWIITLFASVMASGSLAAFMFANNLQSIPLAIFGISFAVAAFPKLSGASARGDMKEFSRILSRTLGRILYFVIPASIFLILLRAELVRVVLGSGMFDWEDTIFTFQILGWLSVSLLAQSVLPLFSRAFYSLENTKTPFIIALASQVVNVAAVFLLLDSFGVLALAMAFSIASTVQAMLLGIALRSNAGAFGNGAIRESLWKILLATIISAIAIQAVKQFFGSISDLDTFWEVFGRLSVSGFVGVGIYALLSHFLSIAEFCDFRKKVYLRLFGKPKTLAMAREERDLGEM
jgi:putative peptidoglycan lipid II flippase